MPSYKFRGKRKNHKNWPKHPRHWPLAKRYGFAISSHVKTYPFEPKAIKVAEVIQFDFPKHLTEEELDDQIETRGAFLTALVRIHRLEDEVRVLKRRLEKNEKD